MRQLYGLSPDEVAFLGEATQHYCETCCPLKGDEHAGYCPMLTWRESVHTSAIERVCKTPTLLWRERFGEKARIRPLSASPRAR